MSSQKVNRYRLSELALFRAYQLEPKEDIIRLEKFGTHVRVQTIGNGEPLLFIHGAPNAGSTWAELASFLPGYKCILLDRPGCGLSDPVSYKNFSARDLTDLIVSVINGVLNHFSIERIPVVASSFGGYLCLLYTLQQPKRISKLILEGCPAMVEGSSLPPFMKIMLAPLLKQLIPKLPTSKSVLRVILKKLGHSYSVNNKLIPEVFIDWYVSLFNNTSTQSHDISMAGKAIHAGKLRPEFMLYDKEIEKTTHPILWLWGKDDPFGSADIAIRLQSKVKYSSVFVFDHSGHLPWLDKPGEHATKINEFLSTG